MRLALFALMILIASTCTGCKSAGGNNTRVVKPKTYNRFYDRKKGKRKKRTQVIRMRG